MATYDPSFSTAGEARLSRPLRLSWSALFGGSLIGWATLFVLSLVGATIGLAAVEPSRSSSIFGDRLARIGVGVGAWGLVAMVVAAFVGSFLIVRIAGERRRREGLLHASVGWGLSSVALGLLAATAMGAAATTASEAAAVNRPAIKRQVNARDGRLTARDQAAIERTSEDTAKALGATAGALALSLCFSLLGGLIACGRSSGRKLGEQLRPRHGAARTRETWTSATGTVVETDGNFGHRDSPTIIPPTH